MAPGCCSGRYYAIMPLNPQTVQIIWMIQRFPAKAHDSSHCCRNAPCLLLAYELTCNIRQHLQNNIGNQSPCKIQIYALFQQGHIKNNNINLFFLGYNLLLLQNFIIISSQMVDSLDNKGITFLFLLTILLQLQWSKFLSDCLFGKICLSAMPNSRSAICCRCSFCSFVDTRAYSYSILKPPIN